MSGLPRCHDNCSIPASARTGDLRHPHRRLARMDTARHGGTGSTLPSDPAQGASGNTPSPRLSPRCHLRCSTLPLIQTFLRIPPKAPGLAAVGAGEAFPFQAPSKPPPQPGTACPHPADAQLTPRQGSPPATSRAEHPSARHEVPRLSPNPLPSSLGGGGTEWAVGSRIADPAPPGTPALRAAGPAVSLGSALPQR